MGKNFIFGCFILFVLFLLGSCSQNGSYNITGEVGKNAKYLAINPRASHPSSTSYKRYRVRNGKVSMTLDLDSTKVYDLDIFINEGSWLSYVFFADGKNLTINPDDSETQEWIIASNSPQNTEYMKFRKGLDETIASSGIRDSIENARVPWNEMYTTEYLDLHARCFSDTSTRTSQMAIGAEMEKMEQDGRAWTVAGQHYNALWRKYSILEDEYYRAHIKDMPFGLASFCVLVEAMENAQRNDFDFGYWLAFYKNEYADKFPDCNLHYNAMDAISKASMMEGKRYIDFSLPDDKGQIQTVSELIEGKVAVIELWASWCRPCRERLNAMKPLYEKYKDAGFVVVSAAREDGNDKAWRNIIVKDKFPWVNMVDLDPWHPIWCSYGDMNSSGTAYLFGTDGRLIKKAPTLQDIEDAIIASQVRLSN